MNPSIYDILDNMQREAEKKKEESKLRKYKSSLHVLQYFYLFINRMKDETGMDESDIKEVIESLMDKGEDHFKQQYELNTRCIYKKEE